MAKVTRTRARFADLAWRHRSRCGPRAVFTARDGSRDELLLDIDPVSGRCRAEFYAHDFEGEGVGRAELTSRRNGGCAAKAHVEVKGLNTLTEKGERLVVDVAATWSIDPILATVEVAGTALVMGPSETDFRAMEVVAGHSYNHFDPEGPEREPCRDPFGDGSSLDLTAAR